MNKLIPIMIINLFEFSQCKMVLNIENIIENARDIERATIKLETTTPSQPPNRPYPTNTTDSSLACTLLSGDMTVWLERYLVSQYHQGLYAKIITKKASTFSYIASGRSEKITFFSEDDTVDDCFVVVNFDKQFDGGVSVSNGTMLYEPWDIGKFLVYFEVKSLRNVTVNVDNLNNAIYSLYVLCNSYLKKEGWRLYQKSNPHKKVFNLVVLEDYVFEVDFRFGGRTLEMELFCHKADGNKFQFKKKGLELSIPMTLKFYCYVKYDIIRRYFPTLFISSLLDVDFGISSKIVEHYFNENLMISYHVTESNITKDLSQRVSVTEDCTSTEMIEGSKENNIIFRFSIECPFLENMLAVISIDIHNKVASLYKTTIYVLCHISDVLQPYVHTSEEVKEKLLELKERYGTTEYEYVVTEMKMNVSSGALLRRHFEIICLFFCLLVFI